jgi:hypothetical protein
MLLQAHLPTNVLALALNILSRISNILLDDDNLARVDKDLLVTSSLCLASIYTNDHPPPLSYWANNVCNGQISTRELDKMVLSILAALDWRVLTLASPSMIGATLHRFERRGERPILATAVTTKPQPQSQCLLLRVDSNCGACWSNGLVTPEVTPPTSALEEPKNLWLPLL